MTLKDILEQSKISQRKLASHVDLSPTAINKIANTGEFPKRRDPQQVVEQIEDYLKKAGVSAKVDWGINADTAKNEPNNEEHKEMLTQLARETYGIRRHPFVNDIKQRDDVFLSDEQRYIRQEMLQAAKFGGFIAVIGESGAGKTTLKRDLMQALHDDEDDVIIVQPQSIDKTKLNTAHLYDAIIDDVSKGVEKPKRSMEYKARQAQSLLANSAKTGIRHCMIIDEAHNLTVPMLKNLKCIWEIDDGITKLMSIVLIAQPELDSKLSDGNANLREVARRCEKIQLLPLDDVGAYVRHKFDRAKLNFDAVFEPDAMLGLTEKLTRRRGDTVVSNLYPLIVNNAVVRALNVGAELGYEKISADVFTGV